MRVVLVVASSLAGNVVVTWTSGQVCDGAKRDHHDPEEAASHADKNQSIHFWSYREGS